MIFLRIISSKKSTIDKVAKILLKESLAVDLNLKRNVERVILKDGELSYEKIYMLTAKTKASLFTKIDEILRAEIKKDFPEFYSTPIVNMDWEQSENISKAVIDDVKASND